MSTALVRYEQARTALAECHRVDEVKDIRDKAEAMAAYARQAKDTELIQYATEIKVRAERRCGELLAQIDRTPGARTDITSSNAGTRYQAALDENDIARSTADRYQQLAAMPAEHFETAVATAKATAGEVTTAFMLREAEKVKRVTVRLSPDERARRAAQQDAARKSRAVKKRKNTLAKIRKLSLDLHILLRELDKLDDASLKIMDAVRHQVDRLLGDRPMEVAP